jgi:hypothetical protein
MFDCTRVNINLCPYSRLCKQKHVGIIVLGSTYTCGHDRAYVFTHVWESSRLCVHTCIGLITLMWTHTYRPYRAAHINTARAQNLSRSRVQIGRNKHEMWREAYKIRLKKTRNPDLLRPSLLLPLSLPFTKTIKLESPCLLLMLCGLGRVALLVTLSKPLWWHTAEACAYAACCGMWECIMCICTHIHRHVFILMWK